MKSPTKEVEKRLAQLRRQVPTRGLERHPEVLTDLSDLPIELRSSAVLKLSETKVIQTIIAFPPQIQRGRDYVPKQALLFASGDVIHLIASIWPDQAPQVTVLKGSGIMYMKATLLLLYGYLEIVAQGQSSPTRLGLEFNTVGWYNLSPPLHQLLLATKATPAAATDKATISPNVLPSVEDLPLKFSNGVRIYGLLPGEELEELVFQPRTWKRQVGLFRKPLAPNTLLLLTSNFVSVIQEELQIEHGWIISYIPRSCIVGMQNRPCGLLNELSVQLKRGNQNFEFKLLLRTQAVQAWRTIWIRHGGLWDELSEGAGT